MVFLAVFTWYWGSFDIQVTMVYIPNAMKTPHRDSYKNIKIKDITYISSYKDSM